MTDPTTFTYDMRMICRITRREISMTTQLRAAVLGTLVVATACGFNSSSCQAQVTGNIQIDPLAIGQAIAGAIQSANNRSAFVKDVLEKTKSQTGGRYNVMVFNMAQGYEFNPAPGTYHYTSCNYQGTIYGVWVFKSGDFRNLGDGGWINWGMWGALHRDDKFVRFDEVTQPVQAAPADADDEDGDDDDDEKDGEH